jgi:hypothetical protein
MSKKYKGDYGYIEYRKKIAIIRTGICLAVTLILFFTGLIYAGSTKNILSIVAALGCLPTGWSAVNLIMFLRAKPCSKAAYDEICAHQGGLLMRYDHVVTSYDKNFNVSASTVLNGNICLLVEDKSYDASDLEKHIKKMMAQNGYSSYSIKAFESLKEFCNRLDQLEKLRSERDIDPRAIEDAWVPGTQETAASVLLSISL